jgi:hypothetical protein
VTASTTAHSPSRGRRIGARVLLLLGILLTLISILSTYVKREALDSGQFDQTSQQLIASPEIQQQVAAALVEALYANVDVSGELTSKLPDNLQGLAAPIAGISRELVDRGAQELLSRPKAQATFAELASFSQQQLIKVLHGDTKALDTTDGNVVLDLRPLVLRLGDRFGFVSNLADKVPQDAAQITILKSDDLKLAQDVTHWLEQVANFVWIFALACWFGALWLARGRRREELRSIGICLAVVGVLVILTRWLAGKYIVDNVVQTDSVRPAADSAWRIITESLAAAGWVALAIGILVAAGAWIVGPGARAVAVREQLAPRLQRVEVAWGAFVVLMAVIVWILPIEVFRTTLVLVVLGAIGFEVFRRQLAAESAAAKDAEPEPAPPAPPADTP